MTSLLQPTHTDGGTSGASVLANAAEWRAQEMLLISEVTRLIGKSLAPEIVLREMLHLIAELLGLNRGRIVLADSFPVLDHFSDAGNMVGTDGPYAATISAGFWSSASPGASSRAVSSSIRYAYGLTSREMARGHYGPGEGVTGRVLATGQPMIVQDIDAEPLFLARSVERPRLPQEPLAFLALPIVVDQSVIGVLACHRIRSHGRALTDDLAILRILATLSGQVLQLRALIREKTRNLEEQNQLLTRTLDRGGSRLGVIGQSPALLRALTELDHCITLNTPVFLMGETGVGKEMFARALHLAGPRKQQPFIKIDCAAIPESLFETEFFGYVHTRPVQPVSRIAVAGTRRIGRLEQAQGGTLFLAEIRELPLPLQARLLDLLDGSDRNAYQAETGTTLDIRLIATGSHDIAEDVARGLINPGLAHLLLANSIRLPPLRERRDDIRTLALHYASRVNQANQRNVSLSHAVLERMERYHWPGNVRELANVIERVILLSDNHTLVAAEIEPFLRAHTSVTQPDYVNQTISHSDTQQTIWPASTSYAFSAAEIPDPDSSSAAGTEASASTVREYRSATSHSANTLLEAVRACNGNKSRAAQLLGLTEKQFGYRWRKYKLGLPSGQSGAGNLNPLSIPNEHANDT